MFFISLIYPEYKLASLVGLVPGLGYFFLKKELFKLKIKDYGFSVVSFTIGFVLTYLAIKKVEVTPVYGAAIVGMFASFIPERKFFLGFSAAVYSGAFAGMIADYHVEEVSTITSIVLIGGSLFYLIKDSFVGLGGKLGSIAFGAMILPLLAGEEVSVFEEIYDDVLSLDPVGELKFKNQFVSTLVVSLFGAVIPYWLVNKYNVSPVRASAIPSFIVAIPLQILPISGFIALVPVIFFGASFVGMSNKKVLGLGALFITSLLFGGVIHFILPLFNGYGGTLGTTACLCCLVGVLFQKAFQGKAVRVETES